MIIPPTLPRTFKPASGTRPLSDAGFTMIELLVVVALVGMIGLFAIPGISSVFKVSLNSSTRDLATTIKETYNSAVMTKKVHRIVYDLKEGKYWVEIGPSGMLMETEETRERDARVKRFASRKSLEEIEEEEKKRASAFMLAKNVTRKPVTLPRGVEFEDISTEQTRDVITEGRAYTHFFPHGMIEQTVIHLKDNSNHQATLVIEPLVGRTKLFQRFVSKEEALGEDAR